MRRIVLAIFVFLCVASAAHAQFTPASGFCTQGGVITVSGLSASPDAMLAYPGCTVTVYISGTLSLATIYSNSTGTPLSNPFTANANGYFVFYTTTGPYDINMSNAGIGTPFTVTVNIGGSGGGGGSNFAVKPALGDGVEFVTSSAAGDGLSWGTAQSNADAGVAINAAIQALPAQGGVVNVSSKATSCYQFSTAIAFDRPVELIGSGGGYNGRSACLIWAGGASPMVTMTASSGLATGSKIENMGFISGGTCTWMLDIDNGTYEPTLRDVYFDSQGTACSAGGVRIGNNTVGSPVQSVNFDHVHIFGQPTNLQLLQLNSFQCNMCEISLATTGNVQIGDNTHLATAIRFNGGNIETDTGTVPSFIVNNVEGLTINSPYAETDGGNWMQVPNTATEASGVVVLGGRFQGNGVAANIFDINLAGASLTVDGASSFNYPLTSNWVNNHAGASMYVALRDLKQDNTNMSYATGNAAAITFGPGISGGSVIGAAIPSLTISCFANGGLGLPCVSLTIPSSLGDLVTSTKFYSPSDAGLPFGSQTTPIVMNIPALTNTETARVFSLTNNGVANCNWGIRVDGDSNVVFDGTCGLSISNPLTQNFGGFTIINNQNTAATDLSINSAGCSTCSKIAGAVTVDIYDDTPSHTHAFEIPAVVATNPPFFPNSVGALSFQTLSASPALAGVLRLSHSDSIDFRNNANSADDTITASAADLPLWNNGPWPGSGGGGVTFPLAANQNANNADTILYTRFQDTGTPTGFAWRLQNHAASSTLASLDVSGNLIANTLTLNAQSTFTLSPTGTVQPFFYAESATAGAANIHPGFYEASASPANAFNTFWYPCTAAGKACLSATTPSADSSQTLVIHGPVNAQTGTTYTIADADEDGLTTLNNAASIAVSLACPSGTSFLNGWKDDLQMIGAGTPTITVSGCTINGSTTLAVPATGVHLVSDGANYHATFNGAGGGSGTVTTTGSPASGNLTKFSGATSITNGDLSGDVTTAGTLVTTLANSGVTAGSCGDATHSCGLTIDAKGRITVQSNNSITAAGLWNGISSPSGNQTLTMTGDSSTWNWGATNQNQMAWDVNGNPTFGLVSYTTAITNSPVITIAGSYENAATPTFATDSWTAQLKIGAGLNGTSTMSWTHAGTTGALLWDWSNGGTQSVSHTFGPAASSTAVLNGVSQINGANGGAKNLPLSCGSLIILNTSLVTEGSINCATGAFSKYNQATVVGSGVDYDTFNTLSGATNTSIGSTAIATLGASDQNFSFTGGISQVNIGTTCTVAGSVTINLTYTDALSGVAITVNPDIDAGTVVPSTSLPFSTSAVGAANIGTFRWMGRAKASTAITYSTTYNNGTCATQANMAMAPVFELR